MDACYFQHEAKHPRTLFFLRDYDHDKTILEHEAFFGQFEMELLLGHYFYLQYEAQLSPYFSRLHEAETYREMIAGSSTVVTASAQAALEAKAAGAKSIFIALETSPLYDIPSLKSYGIAVIEGFDAEALQYALEGEAPAASREIDHF